MREELLAAIPAERTRYTALAAVMICTASIGGFSMFFALSQILGKAEIWFLPLAVFWACFILCIDCWLVSSTAGSRWRTRVSVLVPRLVIAAVFGIAIAEPLVLRVFQTGVVDHVMQQRQDAIDTLRTNLVACNPVPGVATTTREPPGGCGGLILNIASPAAASLARLKGLQAQEATLEAQVSGESSQLTYWQRTVNNECNGRSGPGLTGVPGDGPACHLDQHYASQYLANNPIGAQNATISRLDRQITSLQAGLSGQQASYRTAVARAIQQRLQRQTQPNAPIGMAERFQALAYLSLSDGFIGVASWFVRIFFILVDCLPVLVKFISGSTPYDRLVDIEIASAERQFSRRSGTHDAMSDEENAVTLHGAQAQAARRRKEIDLEVLRQDAERAKNKEDAVDALWRRKLDARRSSGVRPDSPAGGPGWPADYPWDEHDQAVRA